MYNKMSYLTTENPDRYVIFPILHDKIWEQYEKQRAQFWWDTDVEFESQDEKDWESLTPNERRFMESILAFFAAADGVVMDNLATRFLHELQTPETMHYFTIQLMIESIHSITYAKLIDGYIKDKNHQTTLYKANQNDPVIKAKTDWAIKWMNSSASLGERLVAFVCVEGVHFQGEFCAIFWMKERKKLNALTTANYLIAKDENLHTETGILLYKELSDAEKLTDECVHEIFKEAVNIEIAFINDKLDCALLGLNKEDMSSYIKYVANILCEKLGHSRPYPNITRQPFEFMDRVCFNPKESFFERRVTSYRQKRTTDILSIDNIAFDANF